jgi:AcrR family transcriptional regulator
MSVPRQDPYYSRMPGSPVTQERAWSLLDPPAKRERLLRAAGEVFARQGIDAPMPCVAVAAGAGVGSIYRQFPSKRELVAELVVRRLDAIAATAARAAETRERDHWPALVEMLTTLVAQQSSDDIMGEALPTVSDHPSVLAAIDRVNAEFERLLALGRAEGRLRADARTLDLRLLFAATRAARSVAPGGPARMLALVLDALEARRA